LLVIWIENTEPLYLPDESHFIFNVNIKISKYQAFFNHILFIDFVYKFSYNICLKICSEYSLKYGMDQEVEIEGGRLFIVSTPIGNLGDITQRAIFILGAVDVIYAEDTRKSRVLFDYYKINTPVKSYHDFNKEKVTPHIISSLMAQKSVAVVSDAGTPGISDPAFYLVRSAIQNNIAVEAVPGATAFVPALIVSGLPSDRFVFEGFLPVKKGRKTRLEFLATEPRTMIFYESPKRIERTLNDLILTLGDRNAAIVRELTKKFEQIERGTLTYLKNSDRIPKKGEFVLVVEGLTRKTKR